MTEKRTKKTVAEAVVKPKRTKRVKEKQEANGGWDSHNIQKAVQASSEEFDRTHPELARGKKPPRKFTGYSDEKIDRNDLALFLRQNLKLEIVNGGFTDPNNREVRIWLGEDLLTTANFDVRQQREYEG